MTMTKRAKSIFLAPVPSLSRRNAAKRLEDFSRSGYREPVGPTPERLVHAQDAAKIETFSEAVEVSKGDRFDTKLVEMVRYRVEDSPLGKLAARGMLDRESPQMNLVLAQAGREYFRLRQVVGTIRFGSIDLTRESVGSFAPGALFATETQIMAWQTFNAARLKIYEEFRRGVDGIVLDERNPVEVGREIGAYAAPKQAVAVALFVLRLGLTQLAHHFGLLSNSDGAQRAGS